MLIYFKLLFCLILALFATFSLLASVHPILALSYGFANFSFITSANVVMFLFVLFLVGFYLVFATHGFILVFSHKFANFSFQLMLLIIA